MRKTSLNELKKIIVELNTIKYAYDVDLRSALKTIEWMEDMKKSFGML